MSFTKLSIDHVDCQGKRVLMRFGVLDLTFCLIELHNAHLMRILAVLVRQSNIQWNMTVV